MLTPAGRTVVDSFAATCFADGFAAEPPYFTIDPPTSEPVATMILDNEPGYVAATTPVLVMVSDHDEAVTVAQTEALLARQCAAGQVVEHRVVVDGPNHVEAALPVYSQGLDWLAAIIDGAEPVSSCDG